MEYNIWSLRESKKYEIEKYGYAESPDSVDSLWVYQGTDLKEDEEDKTWSTPSFQIAYGDFPDYLDNDCSWTLCSEKLREFIQNNANNSEVIKWLPVNIVNGEIIKTYFALLIEDHLTYENVVDFDKSKKLKDGSIYLPHFKYEEIKGYDIFTLENHGNYVFISEKLKHILKEGELKGVGFEDWKAS